MATAGSAVISIALIMTMMMFCAFICEAIGERVDPLDTSLVRFVYTLALMFWVITIVVAFAFAGSIIVVIYHIVNLFLN